MVNVLVVEDEPEVAALVEDALVEVGFCVTVAHDDRTAFQRLEGEPRSFAAIVTDINLGPGVTGFDIARRARSLNEAIKVVYISGQGPHSDQFGVEAALTVDKPFEPRRLAEQIATFVRGAPQT
ncbi:response regulator transcription factor [Phenylobacterium sp.]|jgi:DNA-binding response OmpR family regulator|uniref:response regulator transcription factor n=1 Tax=Phenylobacterium sp. TaxID=1871053 RepID=UPI002E317D1B|nr:response regulator [Phenylobacterium sp.]HEX4712543.1 response regulator [Phenylobacterium sp.]